MSQPSLSTLIGKNLLDAMKNAPNIGESKEDHRPKFLVVQINT